MLHVWNALLRRVWSRLSSWPREAWLAEAIEWLPTICSWERQWMEFEHFWWFLQFSIILATADHFLARGPQENGVLPLCSITAPDVTQRGVRVNQIIVAKILQRHQVLCLPKTIQPAPTKRQRAEVFVDHVQKLLCPGHPGRSEGGRKVGKRFYRWPIRIRLTWEAHGQHRSSSCSANTPCHRGQRLCQCFRKFQ